MRTLPKPIVITALLVTATSLLSADEPRDDLKSLFEEPAASEARDVRKQLEEAVRAAGGGELAELVEDDAVGYYRADFGDLSVNLTLDFVGEALSLRSESRVRGRLNEVALRRVNHWNEQDGFPRAFLAGSGVVGESPTTMWMLNDDHKTGFDVPPKAIDGCVREFVRAAKIFRRYAVRQREDVPTLSELLASAEPFVVTFDSPSGKRQIEFPGKPTARIVELGTPDGELPEHHWEFRDDDSQMTFTAVHFDYPADVVAKVAAVDILTAIRRQMEEDREAVVANLESSQNARMAGCRFSLRSRAGTEFAMVRLVQIGKRLYRFSVLGVGGVDADRATKFLSSFEAADEPPR